MDGINFSSNKLKIKIVNKIKSKKLKSGLELFKEFYTLLTYSIKQSNLNFEVLTTHAKPLYPLEISQI